MGQDNMPDYETGKYLSPNNPYVKTTPRKWTDSEIDYMLQLKEKGKSVDEICSILNRSSASVSVKLKRLKKGNNTYNQKHLLEKNKINKRFVSHINPSSILDVYHGAGNPAYNGLNVVSNDINPDCECDYHMDALHLLCKLYSEKKKYDLIDLDPFGSAYDCFDLAIKMAKKGLCITLGEMGHKRWKRLDFVKPRYNIGNIDDFSSDNLIHTIQTIGIANKKRLIVFDKKDWQNISRVWFVIEPYKEISQWDSNSFEYTDNYCGKKDKQAKLIWDNKDDSGETKVKWLI